MSTRTRALALTILGLLPILSTATEPQLGLVPSEGVLVLRNGYVLSGRITPQGDNYLVTWGDANEVRMPASQVELVCHNIEEAYSLKRNRLDQFDVRGRLQLADWCLGQKLFARAADQILSALVIDATDPRIKVLRRRLRNATFEQPQSVDSALLVDQTKTTEKSELLLASLPSGAVETYTQAVQPVLLNRCATNACHGSTGKSELRLLRPRVGRILTNRMTQRNLSATLRFVNPQSPQASPLLMKPTTPHGGLPAAVFDETQSAQLEALVRWVHDVSDGARGLPPRVAKPDTVLSQAKSSPFDWRKPFEPDNKDTNRHPRSGESAGPPQTTPSRDPFDPEVFNRRHFPKQRP